MTAPDVPAIKYCRNCRTEPITRLRRVGMHDFYRCSICNWWITCQVCVGYMTTRHQCAGEQDG